MGIGREIPDHILRHGFLACTNHIEVLRHCSLTSSFSSGRQWTLSGRPVDASVDAQWTVKEILACDTNPTHLHHK